MRTQCFWGDTWVLDGRVVGPEAEGGSRIFPLPKPLHQKDTYLQPVRPCRATVALEAWLSLGRAVGKMRRHYWGGGFPCGFISSPALGQDPNP